MYISLQKLSSEQLEIVNHLEAEVDNLGIRVDCIKIISNTFSGYTVVILFVCFTFVASLVAHKYVVAAVVA
jgi:hypothetical protein